MTKDEQLILDEIYKKLEDIDDCSPSVLTGINLDDEITDELRNKVSIEYNCLLILNTDSIQERFGESKFVKEYLSSRILETDNFLLKARYNHFLYCLTKNNLFAQEAIENYQKTISVFNNNIDFLIHRFSKILSIIISLTETARYKIEELKKQIYDYLKSLDVHNRLKTQIISVILRSKLFKTSELSSYIINLCISLSEEEKEHRFIEFNLKQGLKIAVKIQDVASQRKINELLGDYEYLNIKKYFDKPEEIIIPHSNGISILKIIQIL